MPKALLLGYGYTARFIDRLLTDEGWDVVGVRRNWDHADPRIPSSTARLQADLTKPVDWETFPGDARLVVNTAAAGRRGDPGRYRRVYREVARRAVDWLERYRPEAYFYTGSSSVYGEQGGAWVDESTCLDPERETSRILLETEQIYQSASESGLPVVRFRLSGIYGPGRIRSVEAFRQGRVWYHPEEAHFLNKIHVEDIARAVLHLFRFNDSGNLYNLSDGNPPERLEFYRWLSDQLDRPVPEPVGREPRTGNKRVSNQAIRENTGFTFRYPTFRQGLTPLLT